MTRGSSLGPGDPNHRHPVGDPDAFLAAMAPLAAKGIELVEVMPMTPDPVAFVAGLEPLVPRLAEL